MSKMTICKTCSKEVATSAKVCPNCGAKLKGSKLKIVLGIIAGFIVLIIIASACGNKSSNQTSQTSTSQDSSKNSSEKDKNKTTANIYSDILAGFKDSKLKLEKNSSDFITNNPTLFPATEQADISKVEGMVDSSVDYKHLEKNINDYTDKIMQVKGTVIDVKEHKIDDKTFTYMHFSTEDMENFQVIYLGKVDIFKNDSAVCIGMPVALNSFENVSGGTTRAIMVVASTVKKVPAQK